VGVVPFAGYPGGSAIVDRDWWRRAGHSAVRFTQFDFDARLPTDTDVGSRPALLGRDRGWLEWPQLSGTWWIGPHFGVTRS
jgi:hypothetical protein